ncbi:MAG: 2OG-Fe(II) oxygenase [Campylobacterales bacterium]|nr:2OG-Fe(II) oxygenase [Campylobacterales bacterium]
MYQNLYEKITDALVEEGYIVLDNALDIGLTQELMHLCKNEGGFVQAGISDGDAQVDSSIRSNVIRWIDHDNGGAQSKFLEFTQGLQEYLNRHLFLGLNYYESHFAIYEIGNFYEKHYDSFSNYKNRIVSTVFYLNEEWHSEDGGELLIWNNEDAFLDRIIPSMGTLVVFLSEQFPHEVVVAKKKRYSIAGWFRVDKI